MKLVPHAALATLAAVVLVGVAQVQPQRASAATCTIIAPASGVISQTTPADNSRAVCSSDGITSPFGAAALATATGNSLAAAVGLTGGAAVSTATNNSAAFALNNAIGPSGVSLATATNNNFAFAFGVTSPAGAAVPGAFANVTNGFGFAINNGQVVVPAAGKPTCTGPGSLGISIFGFCFNGH